MNNNKLLFSGVILIGVIIAIVLTRQNFLTKNTQTEVTTKNYLNPIRGIKFSYDSTWKADSTVVDGERPVISVLRKNDSLISLSHYSKAASNYPTFNDLKIGTPKVLTFLPGFKKISENTNRINNLDTYIISYNSNDSENNVWQNLSYCFYPLNGEEYYCMTYGTPQNKYNKDDEQQFIRSAETFEVADNN